MQPKIVFQKINLPQNQSLLAVAVSGGADSMCLACLASQWCKENLISMVAVIIDHGLRANSAEEAQWTRAYLQEKGIYSEVLKWEGIKPIANIHYHARKARYDLLTNYCKQYSITHLLTGHNLEDQAETVLMRIYRGSGIDGISGIPFEIKINGITITRPLLKYSRQQIELTLSQIGWEWLDDPSNYNLKFSRAAMRKFLGMLPDKKNWVKKLSLLSENATRVRFFLEAETKNIFKEIVTTSHYGHITIDKDKFIKTAEEISLRLLCYCLKLIGGKEYPPRFRSLKRIYNKILINELIGFTLWGCVIEEKGGLIIISREMRAVEPQKILTHTATWDGRFEIISANNIPASNDIYVRALGIDGWKQIKPKLDREIKLPVPFRKILFSTPAVFDIDGNVIATMFYNCNKFIFKSLICES